MVFTNEDISQVIIKNMALSSLYVISSKCEEIVNKAAIVQKLYHNCDRLTRVTGFDDCQVQGCGSVRFD